MRAGDMEHATVCTTEEECERPVGRFSTRSSKFSADSYAGYRSRASAVPGLTPRQQTQDPNVNNIGWLLMSSAFGNSKVEGLEGLLPSGAPDGRL